MKTPLPALTPPPRPSPRGHRLNVFVAAATVAAARTAAVVLAQHAQPITADAQPWSTTLVVKLADARLDHDRQQSVLRRVMADAGVPVQASAPLGSGWWRLQAGTHDDTLRRLRSDARLVHAMPDLREQRAAVPNDPLFRAPNAADAQWWLDSQSDTTNAAAAGFAQAWDTTKGSAAPVIAVLDSGITSHAELNANVLSGYNFVSKAEYANNGGTGRSAGAADPGDALTQAEINANTGLWDGCIANPTSSWHGTVVAGQLGAVTNNGAGVAGINWNARILPVRVSGKCGASVADMVDGMRWSAGLAVAGVPVNPNPARILVIGFAGVTGASCSTTDPDANVAAAARLYADAITELRNLGVLVVAAAGNQRGAVGRPANCAGVFGVTATNRQGFKAIYANFGPQVQLAAPGGDANNGASCDADLADSGIVSTTNTGTTALSTAGYGAVSGTSFAAPQVAGTAALMWAANPALTLAQVEAGLKASARPHVTAYALGYCTTLNKSRCTLQGTTGGAGLLDAAEAVKYALTPTSYTAPTRTSLGLRSTALSRCGSVQGSEEIPTTPASPPPPSPPPPPPPPAPPPPAPPPAPAAGGGGGGGAASPWWLLALSGAALALRRRAQPRR